MAIIAESARWGDYRRDVHPYKNGPYQLYTKNGFWIKEQHRLVGDYFPERSQIVLDQLREIGLAGEFVTNLQPTMDELLEKNHSNYPNPFHHRVTIAYKLDVSGNVNIDMYSKEGKVVGKLFSGFQEKGSHQVDWKPRNLSGGLYFYRIFNTNDFITGKVIYVK